MDSFEITIDLALSAEIMMLNFVAVIFLKSLQIILWLRYEHCVVWVAHDTYLPVVHFVSTHIILVESITLSIIRLNIAGLSPPVAFQLCTWF